MKQPPRIKNKPLLQGKLEIVRAIHESQRSYIRNELSQMQGLLPILMKRRNGEKWSTEDRAILHRNLRTLSGLSPYLIPLIVPGGILMLPLLAWWLDRRRNGPRNNAAPEQTALYVEQHQENDPG